MKLSTRHTFAHCKQVRSLANAHQFGPVNLIFAPSWRACDLSFHLASSMAARNWRLLFGLPAEGISRAERVAVAQLAEQTQWTGS